MVMSKNKLLYIIGFIFLFSMVQISYAELDYRNRENRWEGIKRPPRSGAVLFLISAKVKHEDCKGPLSGRLKISFNLDDNLVKKYNLQNRQATHLTVREINNTHNYWLDQAKITNYKTDGYINRFEWSTFDVLEQLPGNGITCQNLGVLVRLKESNDTLEKEHIAPAILYQTELPLKVIGYDFSFLPLRDCHLVFFAYKDENKPLSNEQPDDTALFKKTFLHISGNIPFHFLWDTKNLKTGYYALVVNGYLKKKSESFKKTVRFFHTNTVQKQL